MKNEYLILLIVVIVGLVAIFALTFLNAENQEDLTGAWGGGSCEDWDREISMKQPKNKRDCEGAGGKWVKKRAAR
ncbi:MAG: hypothetical protein GTN76_11820 [Candidatus Aenigmarchaeota archaeon]|nr:hypothetical protein [Candidatus Aenigmarchaeota archaeon]